MYKLFYFLNSLIFSYCLFYLTAYHSNLPSSIQSKSFRCSSSLPSHRPLVKSLHCNVICTIYSDMCPLHGCNLEQNTGSAHILLTSCGVCVEPGCKLNQRFAICTNVTETNCFPLGVTVHHINNMLQIHGRNVRS